MMGVLGDATLQTYRCVEDLANKFGDFFVGKIKGIREEIDAVLRYLI